MKKILATLFLGLSLYANSESVALGYLSNFDEAIAKAKKENKMVMLIMIKDGCPWCKKLEERVLLQEEVKKRIQKEFVAVLLNRDKSVYPKYYQTKYTPTTYFIDANTEEEIWSQVGYTKYFLEVLDDAHDVKNSI